MEASQIIELLDLQPLPQEGGYYRETYRAPLVLQSGTLPDHYDGHRNASTAIYFLLTPVEHSAWHILPTDEVFHYYCGDPVEMLLLHPDGRAEWRRLGADLAAGERPQVVVPGGVWQACRLVDGGSYALLGCTVAPGFDFRDFHVAQADEVTRLQAQHPAHADQIARLAPKD